MGRGGKKRERKRGKHDEEINMHSEEKKKKTLISYQNTGSNLAALQTMSAGNYPTQPQMALCCGWLPPSARALVKALNMFSGATIFQVTERRAPSLQTIHYLPPNFFCSFLKQLFGPVTLSSVKGV